MLAKFSGQISLAAPGFEPLVINGQPTSARTQRRLLQGHDCNKLVQQAFPTASKIFAMAHENSLNREASVVHFSFEFDLPDNAVALAEMNTLKAGVEALMLSIRQAGEKVHLAGGLKLEVTGAPATINFYEVRAPAPAQQAA